MDAQLIAAFRIIGQPTQLLQAKLRKMSWVVAIVGGFLLTLISLLLIPFLLNVHLLVSWLFWGLVAYLFFTHTFHYQGADISNIEFYADKIWVKHQFWLPPEANVVSIYVFNNLSLAPVTESFLAANLIELHIHHVYADTFHKLGAHFEIRLNTQQHTHVFFAPIKEREDIVKMQRLLQYWYDHQVFVKESNSRGENIYLLYPQHQVSSEDKKYLDLIEEIGKNEGADN